MKMEHWPVRNPGNVLVDMTTSEPSLAIEIHEAARAQDVHSVDAPVSGGDVGAKNGTLSIMIGGDDEGVPALHRAGTRWAARSCTRAVPEPDNTPRWSTRS
ncbi:MAG: hypothetical protein CM1200mP2_13900 [Planctomycetaceae bacterium]|nr:MAG: hypothetical protein CM1200mP2_13900 [Planctomycetaceae bacterium]